MVIPIPCIYRNTKPSPTTTNFDCLKILLEEKRVCY